MVPRFGRHGGGYGQPALGIESYNHGGIFPLSTNSVNLGRGTESVSGKGAKDSTGKFEARNLKHEGD